MPIKGLHVVVRRAFSPTIANAALSSGSPVRKQSPVLVRLLPRKEDAMRLRTPALAGGAREERSQ